MVERQVKSPFRKRFLLSLSGKLISSLMTTTQMTITKFVQSPFKSLTWLLPQEVLSKFKVHFNIILGSFYFPGRLFIYFFVSHNLSTCSAHLLPCVITLSSLTQRLFITCLQPPVISSLWILIFPSESLHQTSHTYESLHKFVVLYIWKLR